MPYSLQPSRKCKRRLRMRIDTCADVNMMPKGVYQELFSDIGLEKIAPTRVSVSTYTDEAIQILGKCDLYFPHPVSKQKIKATFYVTSGEGSVLLSCATTFKLDLISVRPRLNEVPDDSIVYTSTLDTPQLTDRYKVNLLNMENWRLDEPPDELFPVECYGTKYSSTGQSSTGKHLRREPAPQGRAPQGRAPQGSTPEGTAPQGRAPQGRAPQGSTPQGRAPQGNTPE